MRKSWWISSENEWFIDGGYVTSDHEGGYYEKEER